MNARSPHLALLLACVAPSTLPAPAAAETPAIVRDALPSVAVVSVWKPGKVKPSIAAGFAVDAGRILVCAHAVRGEDKIVVSLPGRADLPGKVEHYDEAADLAVLRIEGKPLRPLVFATKIPAIGSEVIAIGHPFGYVNTVSNGIVSALEREVEMPSGVTLKGLLQTTASINPGNSGGPLLDSSGHVAGVTVALRSDAQNIGFAISSATVRSWLAGKCAVTVDKPSAPKVRPVVLRMDLIPPDPMLPACP